MIQLKSYSKDFEMEYLNAIKKYIDTDIQNKIIESCKKYLPHDFFTGCKKEEFFMAIVLAPYEKLKNAESYIKQHKLDIMNTECFYKSRKNKQTLRKAYKNIFDKFIPVCDSTLNKTTMRVRIVKNSGLSVCPYCNRDYINCRDDDVSGAQLDHFFNKSNFPLFSVSLYNLIPVCGNCNRIKNIQNLSFASPFDSTIDWQNDISFSYNVSSLNDISIIIKCNENLQNNIKGMKINNAYQIHSIEILELVEKVKMYNKSQLEEFEEVLFKATVTDFELKAAIFGPKITTESLLTKPLGKMMSDLHKSLKIYD